MQVHKTDPGPVFDVLTSIMHVEIFTSEGAPRGSYAPFFDLWQENFARIYPRRECNPALYIRHGILVLQLSQVLHNGSAGGNFPPVQKMFGWLAEENSFTSTIRTTAREDLPRNIAEVNALYASLIAPQTRHSLGEVYTPLELAKLVIRHLFQNGLPARWKVLDPACGSGVFIIALLEIMRENGALTQDGLQEVVNCITGFDINPLALFACHANLSLYCHERHLHSPPHWNLLLRDPLFPETPDSQRGNFSHVIGNPPWYNLSAVPNREYQEKLKSLARELSVNPENSANIPNIEIASLFLRQVASKYLTRGGCVAFLMPRNLLKGSQNNRTRYFQDLKDIEIWDFGQTSIFSIEFLACFAQEATNIIKQATVAFQIKYRHVKATKNLLDNTWNFDVQVPQVFMPVFVDHESGSVGRFADAMLLQEMPALTHSAYTPKFHNGARLGPRSFLFVTIDSSNTKYVTIHPDPGEIATCRGRWKVEPFQSAEVHRNNIYECVMSKFLSPFSMSGTKKLFLPLTKTWNFAPSELDPKSLAHFQQLADQYLTLKKDGARQETLWDYISYNGKTLNRMQQRPLKVVYNAIGRKRVKAAILRDVILVDDSLYYYTPDSLDEAYYLAAILNSNIMSFVVVNIKDERNIHKNPWRLPIPAWKATPEQQMIAHMGRQMEEKVTSNLDSLPTNTPKNERDREILHWIRSDLAVLDELIKKLLPVEV